MGENPKGRSAGCQRGETDSNSLHIRLRASSTRPDSPPWRVDEVTVRDSGSAVVLHQPFFPNPIPNPVQGNWGRLWMLYHVGSREIRELLAAPCGTMSSWELLTRGWERVGPQRLCPRRTEGARRVPGCVRDKQTRQEKVGGCSKHQLDQADAA
jgi:hypothetical protein